MLGGVNVRQIALNDKVYRSCQFQRWLLHTRDLFRYTITRHTAPRWLNGDYLLRVVYVHVHVQYILLASISFKIRPLEKEKKKIQFYFPPPSPATAQWLIYPSPSDLRKRRNRRMRLSQKRNKIVYLVEKKTEKLGSLLISWKGKRVCFQNRAGSFCSGGGACFLKVCYVCSCSLSNVIPIQSVIFAQVDLNYLDFFFSPVKSKAKQRLSLSLSLSLWSLN